MKQHSIHIDMIKQVAGRLGPLRSKVVFLGGSATGFHITDKAAPEIRATKDVDIIVEVASIVEYHRLEKTLIELGFFQKIQEDDPDLSLVYQRRYCGCDADRREYPRFLE